MSYRFTLPLLVLLAPALVVAQNATSPIPPGRAQNFDASWLFSRGDAAGADKPEFADASWLHLDLPHDWSIEGPVDQNNATGFRGGFFPSGIAWYRKHFILAPEDAGKTVFIQFDGVMANSDVYINGFNFGHRPYGWVPFQYDLTDHVTFGADKPNVISVRIDLSRQPESRFYAGAGIYRHVWLGIVDQVHIAEGGVFVTTSDVTATKATVNIKTTIQNDSKADVHVAVNLGSARQTRESNATPQMTSGGEMTVPAGKSAEVSSKLVLDNLKDADLWSVDHPNMQALYVNVAAGGNTIDSTVIPFGIRDAVFKSDTGFWLNGKNLKLLGVCIHSEAGAFGTAVPNSVWERRLAVLKSLGVNAIRTAHNPPSKDFLDICDRMGFLVMDEFFDCWNTGKYNLADYHLYFRDWWERDMTSAILRDRNHPSIVLWSVGNEIHDRLASPQGMQQFTNMQNLLHKLDGTRSVTQAILQPNQNNIFTSGYSDLMDVVGVNYHEQDLLNEHKAKPAYKMIGTENHVDLQTWLAMRDNPGYAGQFLWTGIGYLGEGGAWPNIASPETCLIDRDGTIVTDGYQRASWWSQTPMVYMTRTAAARGGARAAGARGAGAGARGAAALPATVPSMDAGDADAAASRQPTPGLDSAGSDWNPSSLAPHNETVQVFSNCQSVELFLNGTSLGAKPKAANDSARTWTVNFVPGTLKAVGSNDGKAAATYELHTASRAAKVTLTNVTSAGREKPDAAADQLLPHDFDHVAAVHVSITDIDGTRIGGTTPEVTFKLTGPGKIAAVDNGAIDNHELFQGSQIRAVDGQCDVWIRSTANAGPITLTASAPGLADGAMTFTAAPGVNQK